LDSYDELFLSVSNTTTGKKVLISLKEVMKIEEWVEAAGEGIDV
jgi:hypothetical protein